MSLLSQIKNYYTTLTNTEKKIANYIQDNLNEIKTLNSSELAKKIRVSQSSIVKFTKKIDYNGFTEFKRALIEATSKKTEDYIHNKITISDSPETMIKKLVNENKIAIDSTIDINNYTSFEKVATLIHESNRIFIFGIGASNLVSSDFAHKLLKLNKTTIYESSSHFQVVNSTLVTESDLVFSISFSGKSKEVLIATKEAKKRGAKIVSLTKLADNPLSEMSDISLYSAVQDGLFRSSAISSRIAQLMVIDIIFLMYALKSPKDNLNRINHASAMIDKLRK